MPRRPRGKRYTRKELELLDRLAYYNSDSPLEFGRKRRKRRSKRRKRSKSKRRKSKKRSRRRRRSKRRKSKRRRFSERRVTMHPGAVIHHPSHPDYNLVAGKKPHYNTVYPMTEENEQLKRDLERKLKGVGNLPPGHRGMLRERRHKPYPSWANKGSRQLVQKRKPMYPAWANKGSRQLT